MFDPGEEWAVLAAPSVLDCTGFVFGEDAEKSEVVTDGVTELLAPSVVFGEVEFDTGGGVVGGDFAGVADEGAEEISKGFFLWNGLELLTPLSHGGVGEGCELLENRWNLAPVVDGGGDVDEGGGVEAAFHSEGEPLISRCGWCGGDATG